MQTKKYIENLFKSKSLNPTRALGQNFLIDGNIMRILLDLAELQNTDVVLEVGSGTGSLTAELAERTGWVVGVELDEMLYDFASDHVSDYRNVELINRDVLRKKGVIEPAVIQKVKDALQRTSQPTFKVVANLPYSVASPLIVNLVTGNLPISLICVTVQREVAERLAASPCTREYGIISVLCQIKAEVTIQRVLPWTVFWPKPDVESAIVTLRMYEQPLYRIKDFATFEKVVRRLFMFRRKVARNALKQLKSFSLTDIEVETILQKIGRQPGHRCECFAVDDFVNIANLLYELK